MVEESPQTLYIWGGDYAVSYELTADSPTDGGWGSDDHFEGGQDTGGYDDYDDQNDAGDNSQDTTYDGDDYNADEDNNAGADDYDYDDYDYDRGDWTDDYNQGINTNIQNPDGSYIIATDMRQFVQLLVDAETVEQAVFVAVFNILAWLGVS